MNINYIQIRSNFFIDVDNVFFYIDTFVCHELIYRIQRDPQYWAYFSKSLVPFINLTDEEIVHITAQKKHKNILLDWIDRDTFLLSNMETDIIPYTDYILKDIIEHPHVNNYIQTTTLGNSISILAKDSNVNSITFYSKYDSEYLLDNIASYINPNINQKLKWADGSKRILFQENDYQTYMLEDVADVEYLLTPHTTVKEIVIPAYYYNIRHDVAPENDIISSLQLDRPAHEYKSDYNLMISSIAVPI